MCQSSSGNQENDIALLLLDGVAEINSNVIPIGLPKGRLPSDVMAGKSIVYVMQ
jgi:hypothetical protein